jgi:hypothetical protein
LTLQTSSPATATPMTKEEPPKTIEESKKAKVKLPKPQPTFAVVQGPIIVSFQ